VSPAPVSPMPSAPAVSAADRPAPAPPEIHCQSCGTAIRYCPYCGAPLNAAEHHS
jgi:hypothetical protein